MGRDKTVAGNGMCRKCVREALKTARSSIREYPATFNPCRPGYARRAAGPDQLHSIANTSERPIISFAIQPLQISRQITKYAGGHIVHDELSEDCCR